MKNPWLALNIIVKILVVEGNDNSRFDINDIVIKKTQNTIQD
jgi:hypothetical protein